MKTKPTIGGRLRSLREHYRDRQVTAKMIADAAGITPMQLNNMENDKVKTYSYDALTRIANYLGSTVEWLQSGNGKMLPAGTVDVAKPSTGDPWKEEAWSLAKEQIAKKDQVIDRLSVAFDRLTEMMQKGNIPFLHPVKGTARRASA
jgi:transcriptional regulator with XRE-family HTH domain